MWILRKQIFKRIYFLPHTKMKTAEQKISFMGVVIGLNHIPVINFSMQQNHVSVIREIIGRNIGEDNLDGLDIMVSFDPEFAEFIVLHVDRISSGSDVRHSDILAHISTAYLSNLTERISGLIKLRFVGCWDITIRLFSFKLNMEFFCPQSSHTKTPCHSWLVSD